VTFWHGIAIGWFLGMATFPLLLLLLARLLACSYDNRDRQKRMSAEWLRQRKDRGAHVSPEAQEWLRKAETGGDDGPEQG
jgi:hypothetical protein